MTDLLIEKNGAVLYLTLNRPEALNAFSGEMIEDITTEMTNAANDDSVKVVVLSGSGRAFSAGGDVKTMGQNTGSAVYEHIGRLNKCILAIQRLEKPVVAVVHGFVAGAGFNLALACDLIVAAEETAFVLSFSKVGLISDGGGLYFLPRLIGMQKAKELFFLAEPLKVEEAKQMGIVNRIVPLEQLKDEAISFATRLSQGPVQSYGKMKKLLQEGLNKSLEDVLELERLTQMLMVESADHKEGVSAFKEKRQPVFTGK
jgi:2-(1,2-epoxy-1,2-dihydrophenyl)acetyl-CoA isomerase